MENVLKDGSVISEEQVQAWKKEAAQGKHPGTPGKWIVRPAHRPATFTEKLDTVSFKLPHSLRVQLDQQAKTAGQTRSDFMRQAIEKELLTV